MREFLKRNAVSLLTLLLCLVLLTAVAEQNRRIEQLESRLAGQLSSMSGAIGGIAGTVSDGVE